MNSRILRSLSPFHFCRPRVSLLLLLHSVADDAALPRRPKPPTRIPRDFSSTHYCSSSSSKKHYEECRDVKVAVWWDFENCSIPAGVNVFLVAQRITSALRSNGIKGPVTITGFGDIELLSPTSREALTSTGVCLNHVPHGGKMSLQSCFMANLIYWVSQNPPPVHFFLISGDKDFANILHHLRMNNYNILLASREFTPGILCRSATLMWSWTCLANGDNASAKHFNHPPDGFYSSWYGLYKAVLDDPFSDMKQANGKGEDYEELSSESKLPVPRDLVNVIQQILHSYPEGMNISDLQNELKSINMTLDKDFFGYKNFSHLLASMPNILKFITVPGLDGQLLVVGKHLRTADSSPLRSKTIQDFDSSDGGMSPTSKQDGKRPSVTPNNDVGLTPATLDKHPSSHTSTQYDMDEGGAFQKFKGYFFRFQHPKEASHLTTKGNDMEANHDISTSKERKIVKRGFLQRIWEGMNHPSGDLPVGGIDSFSGPDSTSNKDSVEAKSTCQPTEKLKYIDKKTNWDYKFSPSKSFREFSESPATDKITRHPDIHSGPPDTKQRLFKSIAGWWSEKSEKDQEGVCARKGGYY